MSLDEIADLKKASGGAVNLSQCDITNEAAVKAWAGEVTIQNEGRIDLLISNAGILTPGPLEVLPLKRYPARFEVNVFGALAVVNSFSPALRKARGRIVQVSTMTATLPFPFNGPSGASKAAFDALAAVYRAELKPFGIDVVLAVAGNMRTGGPAKTAAALRRIGEGMTAEQRELYGKTSIPLRPHSTRCRTAGWTRPPRPGASSNSPNKCPRQAGERSERTPKRFCGSSMRNQMPNRMRCAPDGRPEIAVQVFTTKELPMIELVDTKDSRAVRNKNNVLGFYDLVIDRRSRKTYTGS